MSRLTLEQIVEMVKSLSDDEQRQIRELLDMEVRTDQLRRVQQKYAHLTTSSEAFAARKAEEIELEERRREVLSS